jgi:hypothetical protein
MDEKQVTTKLYEIAKKYKFNLDITRELLRREGYVTIDSYGGNTAYFAYKERKFLQNIS